MSHSSTFSTVQVRKDLSSNPVPPAEASQLIPKKSVVDAVLQLTDTGSPNLTTTSAGVSIRGQSVKWETSILDQSFILLKQSWNKGKFVSVLYHQITEQLLHKAVRPSIHPVHYNIINSFNRMTYLTCRSLSLTFCQAFRKNCNNCWEIAIVSLSLISLCNSCRSRITKLRLFHNQLKVPCSELNVVGYSLQTLFLDLTK